MRVNFASRVGAAVAAVACAATLASCTGSAGPSSASASNNAVASTVPGDGALAILAAIPGTGDAKEYGFATEAGIQLAIRDIRASELGPAITLAITNTGATDGGLTLSDPLPDAIVGPFTGQSVETELPIAARTSGAEPAAASDDFVDRLRTVTPQGLKDTGFAAEAYDAVTVFALAATIAGSDSAQAIASSLPNVFSGSYTCTSFGDCATAIGAGQSIAYLGQAGAATSTDDSLPVQLGGIAFSASDAQMTTTP